MCAFFLLLFHQLSNLAAIQQSLMYRIQVNFSRIWFLYEMRSVLCMRFIVITMGEKKQNISGHSIGQVNWETKSLERRTANGQIQTNQEKLLDEQQYRIVHKPNVARNLVGICFIYWPIPASSQARIESIYLFESLQTPNLVIIFHRIENTIEYYFFLCCRCCSPSPSPSPLSFILFIFHLCFYLILAICHRQAN